MATFNYNKVNLAAAQIPSAITASQTSITVDASESALFPTVPFFATIMPAGGVPNTLNSEIVQVTAINTTSGVLTITRAQRGTTAKAQDEGAVIMNGVYIEDLAQAQAVSKSFFSAKLSSSVYYIQDARLTTTPENGDSIRVVFGSNWTSGTPKLSLNSGTSYNIYAGNNLTASHGTTNTPAMVKSGIIYELTYYNGAWYILNLTANSSITSDNVDWTTLKEPFLVYEYVQPVASSSDVIVDVPVDLVKYRGYIITSNFEASNTSLTWCGHSALDSSKGAIATYQRGFEFNPNFTSLSRDSIEIVAMGAATSCSSKMRIDISRSDTTNYPCFIAEAFGGTETTYAQYMFGRLKNAPNVLKYIRCPLKTPQKNSCVRAYAYY